MVCRNIHHFIVQIPLTSLFLPGCPSHDTKFPRMTQLEILHFSSWMVVRNPPWCNPPTTSNHHFFCAPTSKSLGGRSCNVELKPSSVLMPLLGRKIYKNIGKISWKTQFSLKKLEIYWKNVSSTATFFQPRVLSNVKSSSWCLQKLEAKGHDFLPHQNAQQAVLPVVPNHILQPRAVTAWDAWNDQWRCYTTCGSWKVLGLTYPQYEICWGGLTLSQECLAVSRLYLHFTPTSLTGSTASFCII